MKTSLRKGDLVRSRDAEAFTWRPRTKSEEEAWYEKLREDIKVGRQSYMGEDGEVRIPPRCVTVPVPNSAVLVVTRARMVAMAPSGRRLSGCCEVFWPERGETLFALREELITAW